MKSLSLIRPLALGRKGVAGGGAGNLFPYPFFKELEEAGIWAGRVVVAGGGGGGGPLTQVFVPLHAVQSLTHGLPYTSHFPEPSAPPHGSAHLPSGGS